jgi:immunity protein 52 of polymorphic toxin system
MQIPECKGHLYTTGKEAMSGAYRIMTYWGPRRETTAVLAPRMLRMLQGLADIDPLLADWRWVGKKRLVSMSELDVATAERLLRSRISRDDAGEPVPARGYSFYIHTHWYEPSRLTLQGDIGTCTPSNLYDNNIHVDTNRLSAPDEALLKYRIYKPALSFLATLWRASWASAFPFDLRHQLPKYEKRLDNRLHGGWITYLSAAWAAKITPAKSAIIERAPDGGLLMIATEETFRIDNPRHVAVAREIDAALAPLNALPWPPNDTADGRAVADR